MDTFYLDYYFVVAKQDGEEEFVSVKFVPIKSHVVLLVGGNFRHGNGRWVT